MYFRTYEVRKTWLDKCLKSPVSEDFDKYQGKRPEILFKSERQHLYHIY